MWRFVTVSISYCVVLFFVAIFVLNPLVAELHAKSRVVSRQRESYGNVPGWVRIYRESAKNRTEKGGFRPMMTYNEAVEQFVRVPINAGMANADEFNLREIAEKVLVQTAEGGYTQDPDVTPEEFWDVVEENVI